MTRLHTWFKRDGGMEVRAVLQKPGFEACYCFSHQILLFDRTEDRILDGRIVDRNACGS